VTSSAVSWFDPVAVEYLVELVPVGGAAFGLASFGTFAGGPKIDDLSHARRLPNC